MNDHEQWVIAHSEIPYALFFRLPGQAPVPIWALIWTRLLEQAQKFPSQAAATAVLEEWGLEGKAEVRVICGIED